MIAVGIGFAAVLFRMGRTGGRLVPAARLGIGLSGMLVVFAGLLFGLSYGFTPSENTAPPLESSLFGKVLDEPAPDFTFFHSQTDEPAQLSDYRGKVVLLNFWATWCAPCLEEMPGLNKLQMDYRDQGLVVLTISEEDRATILAFEEMMPLETVSGRIEDPDAMPDRYQDFLMVRPSSYVIDQQGQLRRYVPAARNYAFFEAVVKPLLEPELAAQ